MHVDQSCSDAHDHLPETYRDELAREQRYVGQLYARLDQLRAEKREQLARVRKSGAQGSLQNQSERDAFATQYEDRIAQLDAVEDRLVFGRLDTENEDPRYIGRIGLSSADHSRLLIDWRAPESAAFYQATAQNRGTVQRRRHLLMSRRRVVGFDDDVLDADLVDEDIQYRSSALLSAVTARRTGRMGDIVATIQAEQDEIIRSPLSGVLVVQGGPGTGKTAVALHRAAYLLYTHRQRLESSGVLLVGPSEAFMNYIDQVLPSLGENGVVMSSLAELYPGLKAVAETSRDVARIKGRAVMADVMRHAVQARQRRITTPRELKVETITLTLTPQVVDAALKKARHSGLAHNQAREVFVNEVVDALSDQMIAELAAGSAGKNEADRSYVPTEIRQSVDVRRILNMCWMPLSPEKVLDELLSTPRLLVDAAYMLDNHELLALLREPHAPFTVSDVPLLDELAELLGAVDAATRAVQRAEQRQYERDLANAEATLENVHQSLEDLGVDGVVTAEALARSQGPQHVRRSAAEHAITDRGWTYGHVIVDEGQELTPMQWRVLFRRCPIKSFTIVGDIAQSSNADTTTWRQRLEPFADQATREMELSVNYRTPATIADLAAEVATRHGANISTPKALRAGEDRPRIDVVGVGDRDRHLHEVINRLATDLPAALIAVVVPEALIDTTGQNLSSAFPERIWWGQGLRHDRDLVLVTAYESKGLEYDAVVIVEPQQIVAEAEGSIGDLYVAMTRATQILRMITTDDPEELPAPLEQHCHAVETA
ncbi:MULTISPECIES: HelD family protein [Auritidibacter]|uniref:HelD family protein n=1 Tax=Auritidibacter TaxID=1160973 RepID=UPI000D7347A1|nr:MULTISPECIES: UvrD-helicase domain-containing protein [Auritidibacter]AXR73742.1 AAA family ATPase [Auritidibacter sp. NML130574]WGH84649.1 AAA family ATPase [Auritidibacter ignavus]WGH86961.1 AAA family ATPase [Auritidibacter ignavus]WGH89246.1 AAA family ATPase [Auritidibacter ignavus]WHS34611.1 AAA family ATPase [Auritidibacter ignavus]